MKVGGIKSITRMTIHRTGEYRYFVRKIKTFSKVVGNTKRKPLNLLEIRGLFLVARAGLEPTTFGL